MRQYLAAHPEKREQANLQRRCKRLKNPELIRAQEMASKLRHREKVLARKKRYRQENREKIAAYNKKYEKENRHITRLIVANKRVKRARATPFYCDRQKISDIYKAAKTLEDIHGIKYHVDHIVPINGKNVCGLHVSWNLQILTARENIRKSNNWNSV